MAAAGVDLAVAPGSIHGLVGPNGAGKSTVLGALLGRVSPDAGQITVAGGPRERAAARARGGLAGFVDDPRFYPYLSARQNLRLLGVLDGLPAVERNALVDDLLAQVGLTASAGRKVAGFSLGMRQRLGLASALLRRPSVLVLDEPTNGLDPAGVAELWDILRSIADVGGAVLLSSHDLAAVDSVCDAVSIMSHGTVVWSGPLAALRRHAPPPDVRVQTADDEATAAVASGLGIRARTLPGGGVRLAVATDDLDALTVALGREGIGIRALVPGDSPLRALFTELTTGGAPTAALAAAATPPPAAGVASPAAAPARRALADVAAVCRVEASKLVAQAKVRLLAIVCVLAPFVFAGGIKLAGTLPSDTLFGRWLLESSAAMGLVALTVAGTWVFPLLSSVVAGDILAAEDKLGTWSTLLARSRTPAAIIAGKCVVSVLCAVLAVALLGAASVGAGFALGGTGPLPGLTGQLLSSGHALGLVGVSWAATLPSALAWTAIALALSAFTRSSLIAIALPALLGILFGLTLLFDAPPVLRAVLPTAALDAWHSLFEMPASISPLLSAMLVAVAWTLIGAAALAVALRRRGSLAA